MHKCKFCGDSIDNAKTLEFTCCKCADLLKKEIIAEYLRGLINDCHDYIPSSCPECGNATVEYEEGYDGENESQHRWCTTKGCDWPTGEKGTYESILEMLLEDLED